VGVVLFHGLTVAKEITFSRLTMGVVSMQWLDFKVSCFVFAGPRLMEKSCLPIKKDQLACLLTGDLTGSS